MFDFHYFTWSVCAFHLSDDYKIIPTQYAFDKFKSSRIIQHGGIFWLSAYILWLNNTKVLKS